MTNHETHIVPSEINTEARVTRNMKSKHIIERKRQLVKGFAFDFLLFLCHTDIKGIWAVKNKQHILNNHSSPAFLFWERHQLRRPGPWSHGTFFLPMAGLSALDIQYVIFCESSGSAVWHQWGFTNQSTRMTVL